MFNTRYGSDEMRAIFSETSRRQWWRRLWTVMAETQTGKTLPVLRDHIEKVDLDRAHQIESRIKHELVAELKVFTEQTGYPSLHQGATSSDIEDTINSFLQRQALILISHRLTFLLASLVERIDEQADALCMGYTHLQPAELTTVGHRLARYADDLAYDYAEIGRLINSYRCKGIRGAVGTSNDSTLNFNISKLLEMKTFRIVDQTSTRRQEITLANLLASVGSTLHRLAMDTRVMQSFGQWAEPFDRENQIGSSAMPFKRNPIDSENICSLTRLAHRYTGVAWDNHANHLLERTLDDSANRRVWIPEMFLFTEEALVRAEKIVRGMSFNVHVIRAAVERYFPFAAVDQALAYAVEHGADRLLAHEACRKHSMEAWSYMERGLEGHVLDRVLNDDYLSDYLIGFEPKEDAGNAAIEARLVAKSIRRLIGG